jgi:3-hydroxyisobutyrate dehydrogenase
MTHIAFLGVGAMGLGMAARLAGSGQRVVAYDVSAEALARAAAAGCEAASSAAEAVSGASVVVTMLATGAQVAAAYAQTIVPNAEKGALVIDCSTIDVETARAVAAQAAAAGLRPADAPVSGGTMAAEAGTLAFMVGCDEALFEVVRQALSPMARVTIHAGGAGRGQAAKICNNMVLGVSMLGVCEAFALAEKLGLRRSGHEIASRSSGQSWS